jgi:hypothetical protein
MTDSSAPIEDRDANIRTIVAELLSEAYEDLFNRYDRLHKRNINDNDIIRALRQNGDGRVADDYIEWSGALDPDAEDDNTTMNPAVPDPGDAPSYTALADQLEAVKDAASPSLSTPAIDRFIQHARGEVK